MKKSANQFSYLSIYLPAITFFKNHLIEYDISHFFFFSWYTYRMKHFSYRMAIKWGYFSYILCTVLLVQRCFYFFQYKGSNVFSFFLYHKTIEKRVLFVDTLDYTKVITHE